MPSFFFFFASLLSSFLSSLLLLLSLFLPSLLVLLFSACPLACLVCSCVLVVVSFSLSDYMQKRKGAKVLPLRPLLFCCGCLDSCVVIKELRCRCFGLFQLVWFVLPSNAARVGRLARSYFYPFRHYVDITNNRSAFLK